MSVAGYLEAITETAALGWAWSPGRTEPLPVELRLGEAVVSEALADGAREDLARSGIGEGRHAFTLPVPDALRTRLSELRVVVRTEEGAVVLRSSTPAPGNLPGDEMAARLAQIGQGLELVVRSQRVLHRTVQAALLRPAADTPAASRLDAGQTTLEEGLATLELFVARLEVALAQAAPAPAPAGPRWLLGAAAAASFSALVVAVAALLRVIPA